MPTKFVLRLGAREFALRPGRFLIGRAEQCDITLDDALVSRQHAALVVSGDRVVLEDLGSRNGVKVNGEPATGNRRLWLGDKLAIGSSELELCAPADGAPTLVQAPIEGMSAFGVMGMLADKALALGRGEEAERLVGPQLEQLLSDAERGREIDARTLERASIYALALASTLGRPEWVDVVFKLHRRLRRLCSSTVVDELYATTRKVNLASFVEFRAYLDALRTSELGPADRFLVSRLEGLERSLA